MLFCCFQGCKLSTLYSFHWAWIVPKKKRKKKHPGGICHPIWAIYYKSVVLRPFFRSNVTIMFVCFAALLQIRTWHSTRLVNAKAAKVIKKWISNSASVDAHKRTGKWQAPWSVCWCLRLLNILSLKRFRNNLSVALNIRTHLWIYASRNSCIHIRSPGNSTNHT